MGMGSKEPYVSGMEGGASASPLKERWYNGQKLLPYDDTGHVDGYKPVSDQWTNKDDLMRSRRWLPWVMLSLLIVGILIFTLEAYAGAFPLAEQKAREQINRIERAPTRLEAMPAVIAQAAKLAAKYTERAPLEEMPGVVFLPSRILEARYCAEAVKRHNECKAKNVVALHDNKTIYLDEHLDPVSDELAFSILLHEMIHVMQSRDKSYPNTCLDAFELEKEAVLVQVQFLRDRSNIMSSMVYNSLRLYRCP